MSISKLNVQGLLDRAQIIFTNAVNVEAIRSELEISGYDQPKIDAAKQVYEEALALQTQNELKDLEVKQLSESYKMKSDMLSNYFRLHRQSLKKLFRNDTIIFKALGLDLPIPKTKIEFINETNRLYSAIESNEEVMEKIKIIRIGKDEINEVKALVNTIALLKSQLFQLKAEAQTLTQDRNSKILNLKEHINEILLVAEVALKGKEQMLEAFGVVVK